VKNKTVKILAGAVILFLLMLASWLFLQKKTTAPPLEKAATPALNMLTTEFTYSVVEKGQKRKSTAVIRRKGDVYLFNSTETAAGKKKVVVAATLNPDYETLDWKLNNPEKNIKVTAKRVNDRIILTGAFDKKENNRKEIGIDGRKWLQIYQLGLMKFALNGKKDESFEFWTLNPDDPGSAMVLFANQKGAQAIEVNGEKTAADSLKIGLAGLLSVFWSGDYWFRLSDGIFIKAKVSGDIFVELKGEQAKERGTARPAPKSAKK